VRGDALGLLSADFVIQEKLVTPGGVPIQVLGQDPTRWAVIFASSTNGQPAWVSTKPSVNNNTGIPLFTGFPVFAINFRDHGALVTGSWFAFAPAAANVNIVEILYRPAGLLTVDESDLEEVSQALTRWGQ